MDPSSHAPPTTHATELFTLSSLTHTQPREVTLTLVSFAVTKMAYLKLTRKFSKQYKELTGIDVVFRLSFGGSGVQARAVMDGLPADIVALSLPLDIDKIVSRGLIRKDWRNVFPHKSNVCESVVALVTRPGNPKQIKSWADLTRDDVDIICSNPKTAGVARWNYLALWGHAMRRGDDAAADFVQRVFERVPIQPRDAREASDVFYNQQRGDVLITYENEVILTNWVLGKSKRGPKPLPYIVPDNNVIVEMPVALVDANLARRDETARIAAKAFVNFLYSPDAQREFVKWGFRPTDKGIARESEKSGTFRRVQGLWRVDEKLGGWDKVQAKIFDAGKICDSILQAVAEKQINAKLAASR